MANEDMTTEQFEQLKQQAEGGDVQAMISVGDAIYTYYSRQNKAGTAATEALPWYEQAANSGSVRGAYMSVLLNSILCVSIRILGTWGHLIDISNEILQYARIVLHAPNLSEQVQNQVTDAVDTAVYNMALALYFSHRESDVITFLNSTHMEKGSVQIEALLYGLCLSDPSEEYEWLRVLEGNGKAIMPSTKDIYDQGVMTSAYVTLSTIHRVWKNDCNRAREILLEGLDVIDHEDFRPLLQKELDRYRKKMFGGYQYAG